MPTQAEDEPAWWQPIRPPPRNSGGWWLAVALLAGALALIYSRCNEREQLHEPLDPASGCYRLAGDCGGIAQGESARS